MHTDMSTAVATRKATIRVSGGVHDGAVAELDIDSICVIGRSDRCDVILNEEGVAPEHLALVTRADGMFIRALSHGFSVNGRTVDAGELVAVNGDMAIDLGATQLVLTAHASEASASAVEAAEDAAGEAERTIRSANGKSRFAKRAGIGVLLSAVVLVAAAAVMFDHADRKAPSNAARLEAIAQVTANPIYEGVKVQEINGAVVVGGYVATTQQRNDLAAALMPLGPITNRVEAGNEIASRVREELRLHGIAATTTYKPHGIVIAGVNANALNSDVAERMKATIAHDVPALAGLEFAVTGNAEAQGPPIPLCGSPNINRDALVVLNVVTEAPAYIRTADGAKYFEEGRLPTGHVIKRISQGELALECGGVASVVKL